VALSATIYNLEIDLADQDRGVYEALALRVARHPSESEEYFVTRVLAYALEYDEGIQFSRGISDPDEPTISVRDLTGALLVWVEIGNPDASRLHKAAKAAPRVAVYTHKDPEQLLARLRGEKIHRAGELAIHSFDRSMIGQLSQRLDRRMAFSVSVSDGELYVSTDAETLSGRVTRHVL
jgi:uncharacterized protein YaeQ